MGNKRLSYLSVRVTDDEKDLVDEAARASSLSLSQFVRKRWIASLRRRRGTQKEENTPDQVSAKQQREDLPNA
jgi:hypothetical protein